MGNENKEYDEHGWNFCFLSIIFGFIPCTLYYLFIKTLEFLDKKIPGFLVILFCLTIYCWYIIFIKNLL